ncbi:MAG TPA: 2,3-diaminopropionate biosynthesis protein SbnA [Pyrinomonadaceae bacterium]|nr:2,3-diaminopropionate biosynthesis protein SbnA [Pyrinomonadaceae bacterium]
MNDGILSVVGNTPLVRLQRVLPDVNFQLYAKLESFNPGGSIKDRPAAGILRQARESGALPAGAVVIESSSGNMGIGLAQACSLLGLRFICVVDPKTTPQNIRLIKAYGAEVDLVTEPDPVTGEYLQARIDRVRDLVMATDNSFWPNQYANLFNPISHHQTMREIVDGVGGELDYLFCATSTCGTLRGCSEYIRENGLPTKIFAVDAVGSAIFGSPKTKRLIPGHGAAVVPPLFKDGLADECVHVTDLECVVGCRRLAHREAILAGGSSGAALSAVDKVKHRIPRGARCAVIFPDRGERYLDTIYSDEWVSEHFGDVSHLWDEMTITTNVMEEPVCATVTF